MDDFDMDALKKAMCKAMECMDMTICCHMGMWNFFCHDANGDCKLSKEEFFNACSAMKKKMMEKMGKEFKPCPPEEMEKSFKEADKDGDGFVNMCEWQCFRKMCMMKMMAMKMGMMDCP